MQLLGPAAGRQHHLACSSSLSLRNNTAAAHPAETAEERSLSSLQHLLPTEEKSREGARLIMSTSKKQHSLNTPAADDNRLFSHKDLQLTLSKEHLHLDFISLDNFSLDYTNLNGFTMWVFF